MKTHSEHSWSLLTDRPVFLYDAQYDAHLCYWNGVAMTRAYAIILISNIFCGITPGASQQQHAWIEYKRYYYSGAFRTREWDALLIEKDAYTFLNTLRRFINKHGEPANFFAALRQKYTSQEAFAWLKQATSG